MREPTNIHEDIPEHELEKTPVLTIDDIPDDCGENLPDEWPIHIAGVICRISTDGVLLDHITVKLPDETRLEVMEASEEVGGRFCDGKLVWYWENPLSSFNDWLETIGATVRNEDTGMEIDHGSSE